MTPEQNRTEGRTDEGKSAREVGAGAQRDMSSKKKTTRKKSDMAERMGKGMAAPMGVLHQSYTEGPGERAKMGTGRTSFERGGMPYEMGTGDTKTR